jgi:hypothetical protein
MKMNSFFPKCLLFLAAFSFACEMQGVPFGAPIAALHAMQPVQQTSVPTSHLRVYPTQAASQPPLPPFPPGFRSPLKTETNAPITLHGSIAKVGR